ncbi:hypothetical protein GCM10010435_93740 [Winogradskya consettensis]|uniref:STAS domain-containing protein n=1 Tax=Winogradskya consettensis TaxID=113560 RepID=A0A919T4E1_9ACTN|nr:hypothetical protein [Actinoplanes consettensis]GIM84516.1 hypothetical protein Aco04nite_91780 [Actinoplanes consettensis]
MRTGWPYPSSACDDITTAVIVTDGPVAASVEMSVHGVWSRRLGVDIAAELRGRFADRPGAVIVDLHGLLDEDAASMPLWLAACRIAAALRPSVHLALCLPADAVLAQRLRRIGAHRLPVFATKSEARAAVTKLLPAAACSRQGEVRPHVGRL